MHPLFKWMAQIHEGETFTGVSTIHYQPKEHRYSTCTATIESIGKSHVRLSLSHDKDYKELPKEVMVRKANIYEYGNDFRIITDENDVLTLFVVGKMFFAN